jgi:ribonucleoside-triphosphate reductase
MEKQSNSNHCQAKTEVYSRVCGFFRPVQQWNRGKKAEFRDRKMFKVPASNTNVPSTLRKTS